MYTRIIALAIVCISFFFLPWSFVVFGIIAYTVVYTPAYEVIALGLIADRLYGVSYTWTMATMLLCLLVYFVKSQIRT